MGVQEERKGKEGGKLCERRAVRCPSLGTWPFGTLPLKCAGTGASFFSLHHWMPCGSKDPFPPHPSFTTPLGPRLQLNPPTIHCSSFLLLSFICFRLGVVALAQSWQRWPSYRGVWGAGMEVTFPGSFVTVPHTRGFCFRLSWAQNSGMLPTHICPTSSTSGYNLPFACSSLPAGANSQHPNRFLHGQCCRVELNSSALGSDLPGISYSTHL